MRVLSKIDYGFIIYGSNILEPAYRQVIRAGAYAFRTTPINNIILNSDNLITSENAKKALTA